MLDKSSQHVVAFRVEAELNLLQPRLPARFGEQLDKRRPDTTRYLPRQVEGRACLERVVSRKDRGAVTLHQRQPYVLQHTEGRSVAQRRCWTAGL